MDGYPTCSFPTGRTVLAWMMAVGFAYAEPQTFAPVLQWGSQGDRPGEFHFPIGVATNGAGEVLVADHYNNRVQKFSGTGQRLTVFAVLPNPGAIATDRDGNFYVSHFPVPRLSKERHPDRVGVYAPDGKLLRQWGNTGTGPGEFNMAGGIAVDDSDRVLVADQTNRRVQAFDRQGKFLLQWGKYGLGPGEFGGNSSPNSRVGGPQFVAVDGSGRVYTTEGSVGRIQRFSAAGQPQFAFGDNEDKVGSFGGTAPAYKGLRGPIGICLDRQDRIWVAAVSGRVQLFDPNGKLLALAGRGGGTEPGQFMAPHGLALDRHGALYVVDTYNHRVQKFAVGIGRR